MLLQAGHTHPVGLGDRRRTPLVQVHHQVGGGARLAALELLPGGQGARLAAVAPVIAPRGRDHRLLGVLAADHGLPAVAARAAHSGSPHRSRARSHHVPSQHITGCDSAVARCPVFTSAMIPAVTAMAPWSSRPRSGCRSAPGNPLSRRNLTAAVSARVPFFLAALTPAPASARSPPGGSVRCSVPATPARWAR